MEEIEKRLNRPVGDMRRPGPSGGTVGIEVEQSCAAARRCSARVRCISSKEVCRQGGGMAGYPNDIPTGAGHVSPCIVFRGFVSFLAHLSEGFTLQVAIGQSVEQTCRRQCICYFGYTELWESFTEYL